MKRSTFLVIVLAIVLLLGAVSVYATEISPSTIGILEASMAKSGSTAKVTFAVDTFGSQSIDITVDLLRNVNGKWVVYDTEDFNYTNTNSANKTVSFTVSDSGTYKGKVSVVEVSTTGSTFRASGETSTIGF